MGKIQNRETQEAGDILILRVGNEKQTLVRRYVLESMKGKPKSTGSKSTGSNRGYPSLSCFASIPALRWLSTYRLLRVFCSISVIGPYVPIISFVSDKFQL